MGGGGSRGSSTTVVNIPGPTEEERALQKKQVELLELQIGEARRQSALLEETFPATGELLKEQLSLTRELATFQRAQLTRQEALEQQLTKALEPIEETPERKELRELSEQRALAILRGEAPPLSTQQEGFIEETFKAAETEATTQLREFAEELAATRGLKLTDTPIGETALRERGRLSGQLAGAKASAKLDVSQTQQAFQESVRQFQEGLRQQAFLNRLALTGREAPGLSLGVAGAPTLLAGVPSAYSTPIATNANILGRMQQERLAQTTTTTRGRSSYQPGFFDYYSATMSALGGAVGAFAASSSARLKRDIEPLDDTERSQIPIDGYERARRTVAALPIARWRYKWERDEDRAPHIGPILESSPPEIREDDLHVNVLDMAGLALAAIKGVDRRVDRLEGRLPVGQRARLPVNGRVVEKRRLPVRSAA